MKSVLLSELEEKKLKNRLSKFDTLFRKASGLSNRRYFFTFALNTWLKVNRHATEIKELKNLKRVNQLIKILGFKSIDDISNEGLIYYHDQVYEEMNEWLTSGKPILYIQDNHSFWKFDWTSFFPTWNNFLNPLSEASLQSSQSLAELLARASSLAENEQLQRWGLDSLDKLGTDTEKEQIKNAHQFLLIHVEETAPNLIAELELALNKLQKQTYLILSGSIDPEKMNLDAYHDKLHVLKPFDPYIQNPKSKQLVGEWVSYRCRSTGELSIGHQTSFQIHNDGHLHLHYLDNNQYQRSERILFDSEGFLHFNLTNVNDEGEFTKSCCIFENVFTEDPLMLCGSYTGVSRGESTKREKKVFSGPRVLFNKSSIAKLVWAKGKNIDMIIDKCAKIWHYEIIKNFSLKASFRIKPLNNITSDLLESWYNKQLMPFDSNKSYAYTGYAGYNKEKVCLIKIELEPHLTYFDIKLWYENDEYAGEGIFKSDKFLIAQLKQVKTRFKKPLVLILEHMKGKYEFEGILSGLDINWHNPASVGIVLIKKEIPASTLEDWNNIDDRLQALKKLYINTIKRLDKTNIT